MKKFVSLLPNRRSAFLASGILGMALLVLLLNYLQVQASSAFPPDLSGSEKLVNLATAAPGNTLQYTIVISNSGSDPDVSVVMTDTLPGELTYVNNSCNVAQGGGSCTENNGTISWSGVVNTNAQIVIQFSAAITDTLTGGEVITNTAVISGSTVVVSPVAVTTIISTTYLYLPVMSSSPPVPNLAPIGLPTAANSWTLNWTTSDTTLVTGYEIQESHAANFATVLNTYSANVAATSLSISKSGSPNNVYYYRMRVLTANGPGGWSEVRQVAGEYYDDFSSDTTGWRMVRQDTDDVDNQAYYRNGRFVLEMDSSWDYQIGSSVQPVPDGAYRIESRIQLVGVDNLHSYGIIFGADWDGTTCPNSNYSSCFNHYYRLNVIWAGNLNNEMRFNLKRIDYHEQPNNVGRGVEIIPFKDVGVSDPPSGWQTWTIEVYPTGTIRVLVNGILVGTANDNTYFNDRYFGAFASTDEYNGLEAEFDYFRVTPLN